MKWRLWLMAASTCVSAGTWPYWIQPCTPELARLSGCEAGDAELARWALQAWQTDSRGKLGFLPAPAENEARIRIYWAHGAMGLYGETRPIAFHGEPGAAIYVLPDVAQLGPEIAAAGRRDKLYRDTVVYLTCLHESGHALGREHTADFDDIMYSFAHGGDIREYFARYRRLLRTRADIRKHPGIRLGVK